MTLKENKLKKKSNKSLKRNEYSNFVTPPDFVSDELHTVTVIDATTDDIELLVNLCQLGNELYNVYLYKTEMNQPDWITQAVQKSSAVIVDVNSSNETFCHNEKTFYYGEKTFISPATKVKGILDYFVQRQQEHK